MPGIVSKRAKKYLEVTDPLDLASELAIARACLEMECERYGEAHEEHAEAAKGAIPVKAPDVRGVLAAIATIDRVVARISSLQMLDSIPSNELRALFVSMQAVVRQALSDQPDLVSAIEENWRALPIGDNRAE